MLLILLYQNNGRFAVFCQVGTFKTENHVGLAVELVPGKHPFMIFLDRSTVCVRGAYTHTLPHS